MSSIDSTSDPQVAAETRSRKVFLSQYVNDRLPSWEGLLSAHDVSRLTRRPRWAPAALTLFGKFPTPAKFRGRAISWYRGDVAGWMGKHSLEQPTSPQAASRIRAAITRPARQLHLFGCSWGSAGPRRPRLCLTFPRSAKRTRRHGP